MPARIRAALAVLALAAASVAGVTIIGSAAHSPAPHVLYHV